MEDNNEVFDHVFSCIFSGPEFEANSGTIFENLAKNSSNYVEDILVSIYEVLMSADTPPASKFFALYLLVKATETKNMLLTTQLAANKDLLNKIFLDAQYDKDKPLVEKGLSFFSNKPTKEDALTGRNYIRLVLEALKFWSDNFGSPNKQDVGHMYYFIYSALVNRIKFPDTYFYIGKEIKTPADFHLIHDYPLEKPSDTNNATPQADEDSEGIFLQVIACVTSGLKYKLNSKVIFDRLAQKQNDPIYCQFLLTSIIEILESKEYHPKCKFYSLYLLVQLTETKNLVFLTQLAQKKSLLNRFYKEAKVDNDKDIKIRGQSLFPETLGTPDSVIGRNYRTLLLEAIKFWDAAYSNTETNNPLANFKTLATSVGKVTQFSQENVYIGKKLDIEGLKTGKSLSRMEFLTNIPEEPFESIEDSTNLKKPDLARDHINACITSGKDFLSNYDLIISTLHQNPPVNYIGSLLKNILSILVSLQENSARKFYALYLLAKITEDPNDDFITGLANSKELLNKIFQDGQFDKSKDFSERGMKIFSRDPTLSDRVFGNSYVILILESLKFWSDNYGSKNKNDPGHIFKVMYSALAQKNFEFPGENTYIGIDTNLTISFLEKRIRQSPEIQQRSSQKLPKEEKKVVDDVNKTTVQKEGNGTAMKTEQQETKEGKTKKAPLNPQEVEVSLKKLNQAKNSMKEFFIANEQETQQTQETGVRLAQEYLFVYKNDIEKLYEHLLNDSSSQTDQYLELLIKEDEIVKKTSTSLSNYKGRKIEYGSFRTKILVLLGVLAQTEEEMSKSQRSQRKNEEMSRSLKKAEELNRSLKKSDDERKARTENKNVQPSEETSLRPEQNLRVKTEVITNEDLRKSNQSNQNQQADDNTSKKIEENVTNPSVKGVVEKIKPGIVVTEEQKEILEGKTASPMKKLTLKSPRKDKGNSYFPNQENPGAINEPKQSNNYLSPDVERVSSASPDKEKNNVPPNKVNEVASQKKQEELVKQIQMKQEEKEVVNGDQNEGLRNSRKKIPEEKLKYSLQSIAENISISNIKSSELEQIQESIKNSYLKSGKNAPTFEPLAELKKKEKLEQEIARLKKEKLNLSKETYTLQSQANIDSKILNDEDVSLRSSPKKESNREHREYVFGLQQKIDELQKKVIETNDELMRKEFELEANKRINSGNDNEEIENILKENAELKLKVEKLTKDIEQDSPNSPYKKGRKNELIFRPKVSVHGKVATEKGKGEVRSAQSSLNNYMKKRATEREERPKQTTFTRSNEELIVKSPGQQQERKLNSPDNIFKGREDDQETQLREEIQKIDKGQFGVFTNRNELTSHKLSCLTNGRLLYEDEDLQIGFTCHLISEHPKQKKVLKSVLYYHNKTERYLEKFGVYYGSSTNITHHVRPEALETRIAPGKQAKQQIVSTIKKMPFECARLHGDFSGKGQYKHFSINLPFLVTKFMEFKRTSFDTFEGRWQKRANNVLESEVKMLDSRIITSSEDFGKFFQHLIEVNTDTESLQKEEVVTLGGIFELDLPDLEYFVRINVSSSHKVAFQVAGNEGDDEVVKQILRTLEFLFQI